MNPILLSRQVEAGLKNLVRSSFSSTGAGFEGTIDRFLSEDSNYIKGPWVSVDLPFARAGESETKHLFPFIPLGFTPFKHQLNAFTRLAGERPLSTLVATGTGSGKTEAYLWPILEHCRRNKGKPGIKAILIYPMNALATDQARRIARAITDNPALKGVRAGIYADKEPSFPTDAVTRDEIITRRQAMLSNPPDILLTNYKMLDYLLLRGKDQQLWGQNDPESLRFLVVDELHTFDGAQGADLSLLIRRLKDRLQTPLGHLVCVGSSATLGSGEEAGQELRSYAQTIFGEEFDKDSVIREVRQPIGEVFDTPQYFEWPEPDDVARTLGACLKLDQARTARRLALCLFPSPDDADIAALHEGNPDDVEWRLHLGQLLPQHVVIQWVLKTLARNRGAMRLDAVAEELSSVKALASGKWSAEARRDLVEVAVSLISWARQGSRQRPEALYGVRVQLWVRELARMLFSIPSLGEDGKLQSSTLYHGHDVTDIEARRMLPLVHCSRCGTSAHIGRSAANSNRLWAEVDDIYDDFFNGNTNRLRLIYYEAINRRIRTKRAKLVDTGYLDPESLTFIPRDHDSDHESTQLPVWLYNPTNADGVLDRTCPACGQGQSLVLFGLRAARITAALTGVLYTSEHNEEDPVAKPRLLLFSDSVQDAAHRAAVVEQRNNRSVIQKSLYSALQGSEAQGLLLSDIIKKIPDQLCRELGKENFAAHFIAFDQRYNDAFKRLLSSGSIDGEESFLSRVKTRLGWEYFSDLTYRSHNAQTLENLGLAVAGVLPERIQSAAGRLVQMIRRELPASFQCRENDAELFLDGFLKHLRQQGAVAHEYIETAIITGSPDRPLNYFGSAQRMGLGRTGTLPVPNYRASKESCPVPITLGRTVRGFQNLTQDHSANWYRSWADKFFLGNLSTFDGYDAFWDVVLDCLLDDGIIKKVEQHKDASVYGYLIELDALAASNQVDYLRCDTCSRREVRLAGASPAAGGRCSSIACSGNLKPTQPFQDRFSESLLETDRNHRVVAREHTGILDADTRRSLEQGFISEETAWSPNLISATPTLEMGIDIGDLSTLLLCSVPPEEANYIQRIGRSGRRDGNSLNLTIATARTHDLQFWEDPEYMLSGHVRPPGVNVGAMAVLQRQAAAYTLDRFVSENPNVGDYGKLGAALRARKHQNQNTFPLNWINYLRREGNSLASGFLSLLPDELIERNDIKERVEEYLATSGHESLQWQITSQFDDVENERRKLVEARKELNNEDKRLDYRRAEFKKEEFQKQKDAIRKDKGEINKIIQRTIDDVRVLQFLTDRGVLPNYAFPEEGVKLKSVIFRRGRDDLRAENIGENVHLHEYVRPSSTALSELALGQMFYADGLQVTIDRLDINHQEIQEWRFCQNCSHVALETLEVSRQESCPRCGDDMWSDKGSVHESVRLNTVITTCSEQKASIRDGDDRQQRRYDRSLVPFHTEEEVAAAWYAPGQDGAFPFGFEYIPNCTFRDFNFGPRRDAPSGENRIAGEDRRSAPFRICRYCGSHQQALRDEEDSGTHTARCEAMRRKYEREKWEARIFLMREFKTETIRVLVPIPGEASDDDIKSFVSAIDLGMRRTFSGRVDHIRSTVREAQLDEHVKLRSLYLYDSVPGGSGYLRQLSEHPDSFFQVIRNAADALEGCPCALEERDGCFRCVKSYRSHFGPGEPSRTTALRMVQGVLAVWGGLTSVGADINRRIRDHLLESKLEALFLDALEKEFGEGSLTPAIFEGARRGFQLNIQQENGQRVYWSIEPQVQIDTRFLDMPKRRVDFLISPIGSGKASPIVIEMDGLAFHKDTIADDLLTRLQMIRSGHVRVWTLGWRDLEDDKEEGCPNPFRQSCLGDQHAKVLENAIDMLKVDATMVDGIRMLQEGGSLEGLLCHLKDPLSDPKPALSVLTRTIIGLGQDRQHIPRIIVLSEDSQSFLMDSQAAGHCSDGGLDLYLSADRLQPLSRWLEEYDDCRLVLRGRLPEVRSSHPDKIYTDAWRGLWRMVNFLQDMKGFHLEFEGIDTLSPPDISSAKSTPEVQAWLETKDLVLDDFKPLVDLLIAKQAPPPDIVGEDVTDENGRVIGVMEMLWLKQKVGISDEDLSKPGWTILNVSTSEYSIAEQAANIIRLLAA